jgi:hypothetical protein
MSSTNVLSDKSVNTPMAQQSQDVNTKSDVKSMEYHRQVFQNKLAAADKYVPPLPKTLCTAIAHNAHTRTRGARLTLLDRR